MAPLSPYTSLVLPGPPAQRLVPSEGNVHGRHRKKLAKRGREKPRTLSFGRERTTPPCSVYLFVPAPKYPKTVVTLSFLAAFVGRFPLPGSRPIMDVHHV